MREMERNIESVIKEWFSSAGWTIVANAPDAFAHLRKGRDGKVNISAIARQLTDELATK